MFVFVRLSRISFYHEQIYENVCNTSESITTTKQAVFLKV